MQEEDFATPEAAALAEWAKYPNATARVVSVEYLDDWTAKVVVDTEPSHPMTSTIHRSQSGRWEFGSES